MFCAGKLFSAALAAACCSAKMVGETSVFGFGTAATAGFVLLATVVDFLTATCFGAALTVLTPFTAAILLFTAAFFELFSFFAITTVEVASVDVGFCTMTGCR